MGILGNENTIPANIDSNFEQSVCSKENSFPFVVDSLKAERMISIDSMIRPRNELLLVSNQFDTIYLNEKSQNQKVKEEMMKQDNLFSEEGPFLFIDTTQSLAMQYEGYWAVPPMLDSPEWIEVAGEIEEDLDLEIDIDSSELSLVEGIDYKEDTTNDTDLLAREPILPFQGVSKDDWENREIIYSTPHL